jgi:catechol 2,3-dioxygenase-like lactoylglutathione lyase family enzyme
MILDHIQIAIPPNQEAKARAFYGELLGLQEIEKPEVLKARGGCWFELGNVQLHLGVEHLGVEEGFKPARKAHPAFRVADYQDLQKRLNDAGFTVIPDAVLEGIERFYTHDPFGNRLEYIKVVLE